MSPGEKNIVKSLVAVAWADGRMESLESSVIEGLLSGFDATPEEEAELLAYASVRRSLEADIPLLELSREDRELLFSNAVLLANSDGVESRGERAVLRRLAELLELEFDVIREILAAARPAGGAISPSR
jgi:tellurite resistance protein